MGADGSWDFGSHTHMYRLRTSLTSTSRHGSYNIAAEIFDISHTLNPKKLKAMLTGIFKMHHNQLYTETFQTTDNG